MFTKIINGFKWLLRKKRRDNRLLFTRDNIRIDYEIEYCDKGICLYIEVWFDPEKKFGIKLYDEDSVNVYAFLPADSDDVQITYIVHHGDGRIEDEQIYDALTQGEKSLIREMANEVSLTETKMTIEENYREYVQEEISLDTAYRG